jgi:hypothetical protein
LPLLYLFWPWLLLFWPWLLLSCGGTSFADSFRSKAGCGESSWTVSPVFGSVVGAELEM